MGLNLDKDLKKEILSSLKFFWEQISFHAIITVFGLTSKGL